MMVFKVFRR